MRLLPFIVLLLFTSAVCASAQPIRQQQVREIDKALVERMLAMLGTMRHESRRDALRIKQAYRPLMARTMFEDRAHLQRALKSRDLVPLSRQKQFGIEPRLTGRSVIGGLDLEHQELYVTARPAAMGMLQEIARRIKSGPVEVTSLVRSRAYQRALLGRNANAGTDVPTHVMGYAVDIGLLFTPMETAREIRRVLEEMRAAGRIYFIGERAQLAFHIVPVPSRFGEFERAYADSLLAAEAGAWPGSASRGADGRNQSQRVDGTREDAAEMTRGVSIQETDAPAFAPVGRVAPHDDQECGGGVHLATVEPLGSNSRISRACPHGSIQSKL